MRFVNNGVSSPAPHHHDRGLLALAIFKMIKALLLVLSGLGLLSLLGPRAAAIVHEWLSAITVHQGQHVIQRLISLLNVATPRQIRLAGLASIGYGMLFATEGVGLWFERRWAEYLTIIATSSLIPVELYELARRVTAIRVVALAVNLAAVVYLVYRLRHPLKSHRTLQT
jgi:uncharacterized membrane protein (DUF2068 family)